MASALWSAANGSFLLTAAVATIASLIAAYLLLQSQRSRRAIDAFESSRRWAHLLIALFAISYFAAYSFLSLHRYGKLMCGMWDLGIFESMMANALDGKFFQDYRGGFDHLDVNLAFFLPFYALWRDARMLLLLQTAVLTLAAWPLYLLAREVSKSVFVAAAVAVAYLLYPLLGAGNLYDFHAVSLTPLLFFSMLLFMQRKRWGWYWVFLALLLLVKETEAILVFGTGFYLLSRKEYKIGAITAAVALLWVFLATKLFLPFITGDDFRHFGRYSGISKRLSMFATAKGRHMAMLYSARGLAVFAFAGVPVGFIFMRRWRTLLFILAPVFLVNVLSADRHQQAIFGHYGISVTAGVLAAVALSLGDLRSSDSLKVPSKLPLFLLIMALVSNLLFSYPADERWRPLAFQFQLKRSFNVLSMPPPVASRSGFYGIDEDLRLFHRAV